MDNAKQHIIKKIAQELDCGFDCYYNTQTNEIIALPNFNQISDEDVFQEAFGDDLKKVTKNKAFTKIAALESFEFFKIMECFVSQIDNKLFQEELKTVLEQKKPFQNFKTKIDNSEYRQLWFDFKTLELEKIVETRINHFEK